MDLPGELVELALRIELAEAEQLARAGPPGRQAARQVAGGLAVWKGPGSPYSAAMAMGLAGRVGAAEVDELEAHLAGGPVRVEVAAPAHPSLAAELARRGYRLERQLLVWTLAVNAFREPPSTGAGAFTGGPGERGGPPLVRPILDGEEQAWARVFARALLGRPPRAAAEEASLLALTASTGSACFAAFRDGELAGVGMVSGHQGVATLSGAGVLPTHRGHGLQLVLVAARVRWAASRGLDLAAATTPPGTASQRTLEKAGFRCAYPKAVLVRDR